MIINTGRFIRLKGEYLNSGCCIPYDEIKTIEDAGYTKRSRYTTRGTLIKFIDGSTTTLNIPYEKVIKQLKKIPDFEILG